jgi:hypothetical protein
MSHVASTSLKWILLKIRSFLCRERKMLSLLSWRLEGRVKYVNFHSQALTDVQEDFHSTAYTATSCKYVNEGAVGAKDAWDLTFPALKANSEPGTKWIRDVWAFESWSYNCHLQERERVVLWLLRRRRARLQPFVVVAVSQELHASPLSVVSADSSALYSVHSWRRRRIFARSDVRSKPSRSFCPSLFPDYYVLPG